MKKVLNLAGSYVVDSLQTLTQKLMQPNDFLDTSSKAYGGQMHALYKSNVSDLTYHHSHQDILEQYGALLNMFLMLEIKDWRVV